MYLKVIVKTQAKKESIALKSKDCFLISVKEKPEKNLANKKIIELLADYFKIQKEKIRIINGHHHPHKLLVVEKEL